MQTCSQCNTESPETLDICPQCGADLSEFSTSSVSLKRLQENPRVKAIRLAVQTNACPVCVAMQGTYAKENTPRIPIPGCSHPEICNPFYEPLLDEVYP